MEKIIFKIEKTKSGISTDIQGQYHSLVNMLANALINEPSYVAIINDSIAVAFKELNRRNAELEQSIKPKSKIIVP